MQSATKPSKNILNSLGLLLYAKIIFLDKKKKSYAILFFICKMNSYAFPLTSLYYTFFRGFVKIIL